jgi:hypothetical protein
VVEAGAPARIGAEGMQATVSAVGRVEEVFSVVEVARKESNGYREIDIIKMVCKLGDICFLECWRLCM